MNPTTVFRSAAVAAIAVFLALGLSVPDASAEDFDFDYVCFDVIDEDGGEHLECEEIDDFAQGCADLEYAPEECEVLWDEQPPRRSLARFLALMPPFNPPIPDPNRRPEDLMDRMDGELPDLGLPTLSPIPFDHVPNSY